MVADVPVVQVAVASAAVAAAAAVGFWLGAASPPIEGCSLQVLQLLLPRLCGICGCDVVNNMLADIHPVNAP